MHIEIIPSVSEITPEKVSGKTVVVIDVLRATSVMITAIRNGVDRIIPVLTIEEAFEWREQLGAENTILGGERETLDIMGFDAGNSPFSYTPSFVKNKTLIITTTNGTRAIKACETAKTLLIGGFINAQAIVERVKNEEDVVFVCSGTNNNFTLEDGLCAGYMAHLLSEQTIASFSDYAFANTQLIKRIPEDELLDFASNGWHFHRLVHRELHEDIKYCFAKSMFQTIPVYKNGEIR